MVLVGFVLPFEIVRGGLIGSILCQIVANPILHHFHMFPNWLPGSPAIQTFASINFDFWMSFGIGIQISIALMGFLAVYVALRAARKSVDQAQRGSLTRLPQGRGDFKIPAVLIVFLVSAAGYIWLNHRLVPMFPVWIFAGLALVLTPLYSYISARMFGLTGQALNFPFLGQFAVLGAHYRQPDIWFAPLPIADYGWAAQRFREIELTGTKFSSIVWMEIIMLPLVLIFSLLYWGFIWKSSDVPGPQYPYALKFWPLEAVNRSIWTQINAPGGASWATHAIKPNLIGIGTLIGLGLFGVGRLFNLSTLFIYGFLGGMNNFPHNTIPTFVGALLGRYYFGRIFGQERWRMYAPVLLAGFACGTGLIGMAAIALALIAKTISYLPF
jgi:hypothetical protein